MKDAVKAAIRDQVPINHIERVLKLAEQGRYDINIPVYNTDFQGEAYLTVSGQNSNNSVRIPNAFFRALEQEKDWELTRRTDGAVAKTISSKKRRKGIYSPRAWTTYPPAGRHTGSHRQTSLETYAFRCYSRRQTSTFDI